MIKSNIDSNLAQSLTEAADSIILAIISNTKNEATYLAADATDAAFKVATHADTYATGAAALRADAEYVASGVPVPDLANRPLWPAQQPVSLRRLRNQLEAALRSTADEDWAVWIDWYEDRLAGRLANEALEIARVMLPNALWEQGPMAVNAEIRRLIEAYAKAPAEPMAQAGNDPEVPAPRAAAIEPAWSDRKKLALPRRPAAVDLDPASIIAALQALGEEVASIAEDCRVEGNIDRRPAGYMDGLVPLLSGDAVPSQKDLFRIAHACDVLRGFSGMIREEWPSFLAVRYEMMLLQLERARRRFPKWKEFAGDRGVPLTADEVRRAVPVAAAVVDVLGIDEAATVVEPEIPAAVEIVAAPLAEALAERPGMDPIAAGLELLAEDVLESTNNVLKSLAEAALAAHARATRPALDAAGRILGSFGGAAQNSLETEATRLGAEVGPAATRVLKAVAKIALVGIPGTAGATGLATAYPQYFGWLDPVLKALGIL